MPQSKTKLRNTTSKLPLYYICKRYKRKVRRKRGYHFTNVFSVSDFWPVQPQPGTRATIREEDEHIPTRVFDQCAARFSAIEKIMAELSRSLSIHSNFEAQSIVSLFDFGHLIDKKRPFKK